jgi:predicted acylesterase/phospholipase RssA
MTSPTGAAAASAAGMRTSAGNAALIARAQEILRAFAASGQPAGGVDVAGLFELAMELKAAYQFRYARQLLSVARRGSVPPLPGRGLDAAGFTRLLRQQHALCTYKDPDLPADLRFDRALEILDDGEDLATTTDSTTLGLAGAIWKRKWDFEAARGHLTQALEYYERSHAAARPAADLGSVLNAAYAGTNVAFIRDLLRAEQAADGSAQTGTPKLASDDDISSSTRADVCEMLEPWFGRPDRVPQGDRWWLYLMFAEAAFGLDRYDEAQAALERALEAPHDHWQYESSVRQLAAVARLRLQGAGAADFAASRAGQVLREFLGSYAPALLGTFTGKVGLALSGGGFRASFFHIGVLAKLAELGVLPFVEVLSCVSGGSILGAHYYLELRKLLGAKADGDIAPQDYVDVVWRIHDEFLKGVQRNVRTRVLAEVTTSLKMIALPHYTRTQRLGELYEKILYSRVRDGEGGKARWLSALYVQPLGESGFNPKSDNWRRANKVPMLVLNATTLNTGHNWQFTASWMGEPPSSIVAEIDANDRLRRMYYEEAPRPYKYAPSSKSDRGVRLGHAVAASSCVPGLFEPLSLPRLYPYREVRLVDGGVYDNQGVASLMDQECTVILVSDASGQMGSITRPSGGALDVVMRSNSVLMERVRGSEYTEMVTRLRASFLRGMMFLHLKKDLGTPPVNWIGCQEPADVDAVPSGVLAGVTDYGVLADVEKLLASVRTDLDSFTDAEAYSLMLSGYNMTATYFPENLPAFPKPSNPPVRPRWHFLALTNDVADVQPTDLPQGDLARQLEISARQFFKVWFRPSWQLAGATVLTAALLFAVVVLAGFAARLAAPMLATTATGAVLRAPGLWLALLQAGLALMAAWGVARVAFFKESAAQVLTSMGLGLLGIALWPLNRIHLHLFDPIYLRGGRVTVADEERAEAPAGLTAAQG